MMFSTGALSCMEDNSGYTISDFCEKFRERHGAAECRSFSGRVEALAALFDAMQLGPRDCVFVPALVPSEVVRIILFFGASPVFCDVTAESFCLDHRSLENAVRSVMNVERLYPRAVIAGNFCGVPFPLRAVRDICDRMGLILIEDCGCGYGGIADGRRCGSAGDYAFVGLGGSSVFATGGTGCLLLAYGDYPLSETLISCDGSGYQAADEIYAAPLAAALDSLDERLEGLRDAFFGIKNALRDSDFWVQRCGGRYTPSCAAAVYVAPDESLRDAALECFRNAGLGDLVSPLHAHHKSCFEKCGRGLKTLDNASALAPRSWIADIAGAVNSGRIAALTDCFRLVAENIHE